MTTGHNYGAHDTEWQLILRTLEGYESHDQISRMRIYPVIEFGSGRISNGMVY